MITSQTPLLTKAGKFIVSYHKIGCEFCISLSVDENMENVPIVRVHSSCLFGESFGALDCDCFDQLRGALDLIARNGHGALIYKYQEGRGIGIENKIKALSIQFREKMTTAQVFDHLGFPRDNRVYNVEVQALKDLGYKKIRLITANPKKSAMLSNLGIEVIEELHIKHELNSIALEYVISKQKELFHYPIYGEHESE